MSTHPPISVWPAERNMLIGRAGPTAPPPWARRAASAYLEPQDRGGQRGGFPEVSLLLALQSKLGADGGRVGHWPCSAGHPTPGMCRVWWCLCLSPRAAWWPLPHQPPLFVRVRRRGVSQAGICAAEDGATSPHLAEPLKSPRVAVDSGSQMKMTFEYNYKYECSAQFFPKYWMDFFFFFKDAIALRSLVHFNFY